MTAIDLEILNPDEEKLHPEIGPSQRAHLDPFAEIDLLEVTKKRKEMKSRMRKSQSATGLPARTDPRRATFSVRTGAPSQGQHKPSSPMANSGSLMLEPSLKPYVTRGFTTEDKRERKKSLAEIKIGKWQASPEGQLVDMPTHISEKLEMAYRAADMNMGVWDAGIFRDFDLSKLQELPGLKPLKRVHLNEHEDKRAHDLNLAAEDLTPRKEEVQETRRKRVLDWSGVPHDCIPRDRLSCA